MKHVCQLPPSCFHEFPLCPQSLLAQWLGNFGLTSFIYKVANLIRVLLSYPLWLQDWPLGTLQEETDITEALSLLLGSGVWGIAPSGIWSFLLVSV